MAEKTADKRRYFVLANAQDDHGISPMAQVTPKEPAVAGEERRLPELAKQKDDLLVLQALSTLVHSNLPNRNPPGFEQEALSIEDVLVKKDQAWTGSRTYSCAMY